MHLPLSKPLLFIFIFVFIFFFSDAVSERRYRDLGELPGREKGFYFALMNDLLMSCGLFFPVNDL